MRDPQLRAMVYDTTMESSAWVDALANRLASSFALELGVFVALIQPGGRTVAGQGLPFDLQTIREIMSREEVLTAMEFGTRPRPTVATGQHLGLGAGEVVEQFWRFLIDHSVADFLFVAAAAADWEIVIFVPTRRPAEFADDAFMQWYRLAVHLSAAMRLRISRDESAQEPVDEIWQRLLEGRLQLIQRFHTGGRCVLLLQECLPAHVAAHALSDREKQVVTLAGRGLANKQIGFELGLSVSTVATHLKRGLTKLGFESRVELVQHASRLTQGRLHEVSAPASLSDSDFDDVEAALVEFERELIKLVRSGPLQHLSDARRARVTELRRSLRAMERLLKSVGA